MKKITPALKNTLIAIGFIVLLALVYQIYNSNNKINLSDTSVETTTLETPTSAPTEIPSPSPSPTPTKIPLAGPCANIPVIFYHHIENLDVADAKGFKKLAVDTKTFTEQMTYLKSKGYNSILPQELTNFFDAGTPLPSKPIMITFDDGYDDFATNAAPVLNQLGLKAVEFIPTGLLENPGYMSWNTVQSLANGSIEFSNHTWSHRSVAGDQQTVEKEIDTADKQLSAHNLNLSKTFAYPYGNDNAFSENYLRSIGYKLAFTTEPGKTQCKGGRFNLPRTRIGNAPLSFYGL